MVVVRYGFSGFHKQTDNKDSETRVKRMNDDVPMTYDENSSVTLFSSERVKFANYPRVPNKRGGVRIIGGSEMFQYNNKGVGIIGGGCLEK